MYPRAFERAGAFGPTLAEQRQAYRAALGEAIRVRPSRTLGSLAYYANRLLPTAKQLALANKLRAERGLPAIDCPTRERAASLHARRSSAYKAEQTAAIAAREANRPLKPPGAAK
jgi:hypothetical protein